MKTALLQLLCILLGATNAFTADDVYKSERFATIINKGDSLKVRVSDPKASIPLLVHHFGEGQRFLQEVAAAEFALDDEKDPLRENLLSQPYSRIPHYTRDRRYILLFGGETLALAVNADTVFIPLPHGMIDDFRGKFLGKAVKEFTVKVTLKITLRSYPLKGGSGTEDKDSITFPCLITVGEK